MQAVTIACVNANNYCGRGVEYVNNLYRAVKRNTTVPFEFHCLTDSHLSGVGPRYDDEIIRHPLHYCLKGWWSKMELFIDHTFRDQVIYFDLDTVIVGNIDPLLKYWSLFAMLRDVMRPKLKASGIMSWSCRASYAPHIWDEYILAGFPTDYSEGDGGFIADHQLAEPDLLQNHVDGIYSYKVDCKAGLPADARVVCFHGLPRPHQVNDDWVKRHWDGTGKTS